MKIIEFNYNQVYEMNLDLIRFKYKNESDEFYQQKAKEWTEKNRLDNIKVNVKYKLLEYGGIGNKEARRMAESLINELPEELYPNVFEWIEDKPITDIDYNGMSIKRIMKEHEMLSGRKLNFFLATDIMRTYIRGGCKDKKVCAHSLIWDGGSF